MKTVLALVSMAVLAAGCVITSDDDGACTSLDNYCSDPWYINYCDEVTGNMLGTDCQNECTTQEDTWSQACSAPALAGECSDVDGACLCWCQESFDSCLDDETVEYIREGVTYDLNCREYYKDTCDGYCDAAAGACACL